MQDIFGAAFTDEANTPDGQTLFEGAVLAILARVLDTGIRIDLAVSEYLKSFPIGADEFHIRPDLIICVSDCLGLLSRASGQDGNNRLTLDDATRAWRDTKVADRLAAEAGTTRIQACIGNIRRAIGPIA